jgi:hypothetical protein
MNLEELLPPHVMREYENKSENALEDLVTDDFVEIYDIEIPVCKGVKEGDYFPAPPHYHLPKKGALANILQDITIALACRRHVYIHGPSGAGKDAFLQAYSFLTRSPAKIFQITPETDVQSWLFSMRLSKEGTYVQEGELLKALRDGYTTEEGNVIPYLIIISDFDRATADQAEHLRLVMDSIKGRIVGLNGETYDVLPGTCIAVTANTSGSGDARGRFVSSNILDMSLLARFGRFFEFTWMDWYDERKILMKKYPEMFKEMPSMRTFLGRCVSCVRSAIVKDDLDVEFGHRGLCRWLGHANDLRVMLPDYESPFDYLKRGLGAYLGGLPDDVIREKVLSYLDPHIPGGTLDEGDTDHIEGTLAP